jgi:hypothetical protein
MGDLLDLQALLCDHPLGPALFDKPVYLGLVSVVV